MRLLVYSHDAFGLGNIRRMLAICEHLLNEISDLSILLLSGSPMLQGFRLPKGLDYIKLPCLNRGHTGKIAAKYLGIGMDETVKMRSDLILSATANFQPDLFLVDKKAYGLQNELTATVNYLHTALPETKLVLLLRDILDSPEKTIAEWQRHGYYEAIEKFYDQLLIVGMPEVFDFCKKYQFPASVAEKARYCGYIRRQPGRKRRDTVRREQGVSSEQKLVLVTPGGGEDGYQLIDTYLEGLALLALGNKEPHRRSGHREKVGEFLSVDDCKSLIICGPEMPVAQKQALYEKAEKYPQVQMGEFTDDLMSYMTAADAVVSMGGYNTLCEIFSAGKPGVVVPRVKPSGEQLLRVARMSRLGLFKAIHPEQLTPDLLIDTLLTQLSVDSLSPSLQLDLDALPRITHYISRLLSTTASDRKLTYLYKKSAPTPRLATVVQ